MSDQDLSNIVDRVHEAYQKLDEAPYRDNEGTLWRREDVINLLGDIVVDYHEHLSEPSMVRGKVS